MASHLRKPNLIGGGVTHISNFQYITIIIKLLLLSKYEDRNLDTAKHYDYACAVIGSSPSVIAS